MTRFQGLLHLLVILGGVACQSYPERIDQRRSQFRADSLAQAHFIVAGDSVYARRQGFNSFAASMPYYDSAQAIADRWHNPLMQARAVSARGRVYDAWNKQPQQTIRYFRLASDLYQRIPGKYYHYLYYKHLVAHAYDKIQDSTHATTVLSEMLGELSRQDTARLHQFDFTAEMALIATEVRAYALANQILARLTRRAWIRNDPETYDYLNHYYLTRSRIDLFGRKQPQSTYADSLATVLTQSHNLMDSLYYATNLAQLREAQGRYRQATQYWDIRLRLDQRLNHDQAIAQMQQALIQSELLAEKGKLALRQTIHRNQVTALWIMGGLLLIITLMSLLIARRNTVYRVQSRHLSAVNGQLDRKVEQVELLHKEVEHRVKNNLHMIYSMLQMQERQSDDPATIQQLQQARLRVESIATLHNQLTDSQDSMDIGGYCDDLIAAVVRCFSYCLPVETHLTIEPLRLPRSHYLPLSLILTEWMMNSLKHAVPDADTLHITVTLQQVASRIRLTYADNGVLNRVHTPSTPGLGMAIIKLLSRQLGAELMTHPAQPYHYQLTFSDGRQTDDFYR